MRKKRGMAIVLAGILAAGCMMHIPVVAAGKKYVTKIKITNRSEVKEEMKIGDTIRLKTKLTPSEHKDKIKYISSDEKVAVVSGKGTVRAVGAGKALITVRSVKGKCRTQIKVTVKEEPAAAVQMGEKTIRVTCGVDMLDQQITVKKNGEVCLFEKALSEDGKTAVLTLDNRITEGSYMVTVGEEHVSFQGEMARETSLEILGEFLAMNDYAGNATKATIGYCVRNQFGEDITKKVSVTAICSVGNASANSQTGVITVTGDAFRYLQKESKATIMLSCMVGTEMLTTQKEVTLSDRPTIKKAEITLYSPEMLTLTDDFDGDDEFYLLFDLEDQYGNRYTEVNRDNSHIFETLNINFVGGVTGLILEGQMTDAAGITPARDLLKESITVDGITRPAARLALAADADYASYGTASLNVYSFGGGNVTVPVPVAYGTTIDVFRVLGSDMVVQGEDVLFEYEAYDAYGEPVTKLSAFRALAGANEAFNKEFRFVKERGEVKLYHKETSTEDPGFRHMSVITPNTKGVSNFQYTVMAAARPTLIAGLKDIETGIIGTNSIEFRVKNFIIEDQYGRVMSDDDVYLHDGTYTIVAVPENEEDFDIQKTSLIELNNSGYTVVKFKFQDASRVMNFRIAGFAGQEITDILQYDRAKVENIPYDKIHRNLTQYSELSAKLTSAEIRNLRQFEVRNIEKIYYGARVNSGYAEELEVYGMAGNAKIKLSPQDYTVVIQDSHEVEENNARGVDGLKYDAGYQQLYSTFAEEDFETPDGEWTGELTRNADVILNATGEVVSSQKIRICKEAPRVATASLKTKQGRLIRDIQLTPAQLENFSKPGGYLEELVQYVRFTDQYGASDALTNAGKPSEITELNMTFRMTDAQTRTGMISGNGTATPSFINFKAGDEIELEMRFSGGAVLATTISVI